MICPHCGGPSRWQTPRYPDAVCEACRARLTDASGRPVDAYNATMMGTGLLIQHRDDESRCVSGSERGTVMIDGRPYRAVEGRFGGVVVRPLPE